ncbi:MAG: hypothetical protein BGO98_40185 [Myxococcales bacterium 68-20]|nr:MAG: hypothetical protein BGO98_40185 [Myxococcales bacterium 68-20]
MPTPTPEVEAGPDVGPTELDASACTDCEYFPETCSADVLCPNGPFDANSSESLDVRTSIESIRGRSSKDVWVVGALGAIAHFDGVVWKRSDAETQDTLMNLWLRESSEVALGGFGQVYARGVEIVDGGASPSIDGWAPYSPTYVAGQKLTDARVVGVWAAPGSEWLWCAAQTSSTSTTTSATAGLWRLRQRPSTPFEGNVAVATSVCRQNACTQMTSVHGASADELWAVGIEGSIVRVNDAESASPSVRGFNSQTLNALNGVWSASASEAWAVGVAGTIRHYTGDPARWDIVSNVPTSVDLNAVWGTSPSDVWVVGDRGVVLHYDGNGWSRVKIAGIGQDRPDLKTVWSAAPGHPWIGGRGVVLSLGGKP